MALGHREGEQKPLWVATQDLPRSPGHPFYQRLNALLDKAGFDRFVEDLCRPYYAERGRRSIPPGVYFRMLFVGYFEGIDSQRGIAWRCSDSLSLREFLLLGAQGKVPDHSSLTVIRQRLEPRVFDEVFVFVLQMLREHGLLDGRTVAVDSTSLEANAAMKTIVRRATGEDWKAYVQRLMSEEEGVKDPGGDDVRRFDRKRKKRVSNEDWASKSDADARIMKMKNGTTRLAYKAEHVVDLEHDVVLHAAVYLANDSDAETLVPSVLEAEAKLARAGHDEAVEDIVADKGYHKTATLQVCHQEGWRTYIPERKGPRRRWEKQSPEARASVYANRRRVRDARGRRLQRLRSEQVERSFAQTCLTGKARRTWIRGRCEVGKRYCIQVAARNLGRLMHALCGHGTPRSLQSALRALSSLILTAIAAVCSERAGLIRLQQTLMGAFESLGHSPMRLCFEGPAPRSSTDC
jgi:transposase